MNGFVEAKQGPDLCLTRTSRKAIGGQIYKGRHKSMRRSVTNAKDLHPTFINWEEFLTRKSIPYWRLYRFGQRYDIFRIPVNTGVPFRIYHYFLLFYTIYKVIFLITQYITLATFYIFYGIINFYHNSSYDKL